MGYVGPVTDRQAENDIDGSMRTCLAPQSIRSSPSSLVRNNALLAVPKSGKSRMIMASHAVFYCLCIISLSGTTNAKLADRGRVVKLRQESSNAAKNINSRIMVINEMVPELPIEGPGYRSSNGFETRAEKRKKLVNVLNHKNSNSLRGNNVIDPFLGSSSSEDFLLAMESNMEDSDRRKLSSQLTGCCSNYQTVDAMSLCYTYGEDCTSGEQPSHDSSDESCEMEGLSFIGISFSVNTALGSPYSYQLNDQFPMENIIDRDYNYVMSMDEDGWLVGGGYKSFDDSGKMPYIDSSHTELLRIGSVDPSYGGTSLDQVYDAMESISFPPFSVFPEYVKGGGGGHSGDSDSSSVPSADITLIVSVMEEYSSNNAYSDYELFLADLFTAMESAGGGACMDDHDTDPHVSMSRGVKFKSSYHSQQYFWNANLEVAVWQAMYPKGTVIGSTASANFPPNQAFKNRQTVGYGNLYFFFDRANITKSWKASRDLYSSEEYYAELLESGEGDYYTSVTTIDFDYNQASGSNDDNEQQYYEHNPYSWNAKMAKHDMTDGWDLPPNCGQEGEMFFGIPLSRASSSKLQLTTTFQEQFDFEPLTDRNFSYVAEFGTNHGWLIGETLNNGPASIVDKDTAHIPLFYFGSTNSDMGGMSLSDAVKVAKSLEFGKLYIKPAFVFQDDDSSIKLQFEADASSSLGYLYDNLCKEIGIAWNYDKPYNKYGIYTSCAMHAAGDRSKYGCGPDNTGNGGFCPQMTLAYRVSFQSDEHAQAYLYKANQYVDYWRSMYPSGVAVGTSSFCPDGGCLGLFLNRYDLYSVFKPDLGGSWVEFNGGTAAPTISPAPTYDGGCDNPHNSHLDMCFRRSHKPNTSAVVWESLGAVGQLSVLLVAFMATTLSISIFLSRARKRKRHGESYIGFFIRDLKRRKKRKRLKKKDRGALEEEMLPDGFDDDTYNPPPPPPRPGRGTSKSRKPRSRSRSKSRRGRSASRGRSSSRARSVQKDEETNVTKSSSRNEKEKDKTRSSSSNKGDRAKSKSRTHSQERNKSKTRSRSQSRLRSKKNQSTDSESGGEGIRIDRKMSRRRQLV